MTNLIMATNVRFAMSLLLSLALCRTSWHFPLFPITPYASGNRENRVTIYLHRRMICAKFESDKAFDTPNSACVDHRFLDREVSFDFS